MVVNDRVHWEKIMKKIGVHNNNNNSADDDDDDDATNNITPGHKLHWFNTEVHDWDNFWLLNIRKNLNKKQTFTL